DAFRARPEDRRAYLSSHMRSAQGRVAQAADNQMILNILNLGLLIGTLIFTGVAAAAARRTVATMRDTGERQLRAYVGISKMALEGAAVRMSIKNIGHTPARDVSLRVRTFLENVPFDESALQIDNPDNSTQFGVLWPQGAVNTGVEDNRLAQ